MPPNESKRKISAYLIVTVMLITVFAGFSTSYPITSNTEIEKFQLPEFDFYNKISDTNLDPYLEEKLDGLSDGDYVDIIVQFYDEINDNDRRFLERTGFAINKEFHVIPAVYGFATPNLIRAISNYERTYWIEFNEQFEYLMDETTTTTNATKVWDTYITDVTGEINKPVDGTDVTVVVVDSGIDAGHPDLDFGEKVILNYKSDVDGAYTSVENSDTSSGHGTHCSGTIGGNGDASAQARRGMAPGCKIIGISTGEAVSILNALGALQWTYDHSKPNSNPYNIRVVSNSWGTNAQYNPEDAIVKVTEKLTYENNVLVVFAAGNSGENNHLGEEVTTNPYSLTPAVISVAATLKTPDGLAYFSSRGSAADNFTWPDVGAPGFKIWATEARKTLITANVKMGSNDDAMDGYYMAISGTSMATPHVAGLAALLWEAAPSLRVSSIHDEYSGNGDYVNEEYWTTPNTLIHEIELIMKLTSKYMMPDEHAANSENDNGIPDNYSIGAGGKRYDFAQGYGFIDSEKAVALALTLEKLRYGNSQATVWDALHSYQDIITKRKVTGKTNILKTEWKGEWSYLNDGRESAVFTNHPRNVYIPNETTKLIIDLSFNSIDIPERQGGSISLTLDYDNDGNADWQSESSLSGSLDGVRHEEIPISGGMEQYKDSLWTFNIIGQGVSWPIEDIISAGNPLNVGEKDFREALIEYDVSLQVVLDTSANETTEVAFQDLRANVGWLEYGIPSGDYAEGEVEMQGNFFDLSYAAMPEEEPAKGKNVERSSLWPWIILLIVILLGAWYYMRNKQGKPFLPSFLSQPKQKSQQAEAGKSADDAGRVEKKPEEKSAVETKTEPSEEKSEVIEVQEVGD